MVTHSLAVILLSSFGLFAADSAAELDVWGTRSGLSFELNHGQTSAEVKYLARTPGGTLFITASGVVAAAGDRTAEFDLAGADRDATWEALEPTGRTTS